VIVKKEEAGRGARLGGQGGEGVIFRVELEHGAKVNGANDVHVVKKKWLVETRGVFEEEPGGSFQTTTRVEQKIIFARDFDAQAKIVVSFQVVDDHVRKVMHVDNHFCDAKHTQASQGDFEKSTAVQFNECFRACIGQGTKTCAKASGKDHGLHASAFIGALSACPVSPAPGATQ